MTMSVKRGRPKRPAESENINAWIPRALKKALRRLAESNRRTLAAELVLALERACRDAGISTNGEHP